MGSAENVKKGAWSALEDKILLNYIQIHGEGNWKLLSQRAGLKRCGKSCRMRWMNYLRPDIKRGNISKEEEDLIIKLHNLLGNRWSLIAKRLPGRTDNEIKNYWNTHLRKRVENTKSTNSRDEVTTSTVFRPKPVRCSKVSEFQSSSTFEGEEHNNSADLQLDLDINEFIFENPNFDWQYSLFCDIGF